MSRYQSSRRILRNTMCSLLAISACVSMSGQAQAATKSFKAIADSFVAEQKATDPRGERERITTTGAASERRRIYLKFKVDGLPAGAKIISTRLKVLALETAGANVGVFSAQSNDWSEASLTWTQQPWWDTTRIANVASHKAGKWSTFDLGATIKAQGTYSYVLSMPAGESVYARFYSRENGAPKAPYLEVTYSTSEDQPDIGYPKVASVPYLDETNHGEAWLSACKRMIARGYTGCVRYLGDGDRIAWDAPFQQLARDLGDVPIHIQLTSKDYSRSGLAEVLNNLPPAWRPSFIYNYYQEPEDNLISDAQEKGYRDVYSDAADLIREYRARGVHYQLPWLEFQDWTLSPGNNNPWAEDRLDGLIPPAGDYEGILWSMYDWNRNIGNIDGYIENIVKRGMNVYARGKPWGMMATGAPYIVPGVPYNPGEIPNSVKSAQAAWFTAAHNKTKAAGSVGFAWFDVLHEMKSGWNESRSDVNPYLVDALQSLPED